MGKATIVEEIGEGQYTVALDYGSEIIDARVAAIDARITQIDAALADLATDIASARADYTAAQSDVNDAIAALRAAIESGGEYDDELEAAKEAGIAAVQASAELEKLLSDKSLLDAEKAGLLLERAALLATEVESEAVIWCVDYSLGASGEVATIEVPGDAALTLIAPQAPAPANTDGQVLAREVQEGYQLFFNAAVLPGWQKWMPLWRLGEITALDGDVCDVALDTVTSTGQALDINQAPDLAGVPIEYMSCNGAAFNVGDRVVVAFTDQDWAQPKVIGFESEPRACAGLLLHVDGDTSPPNTLYFAVAGQSEGQTRWGSSVDERGLGYGENYGDAGWSNGVFAVSWTRAYNGSFFFRGQKSYYFADSGGDLNDNIGLYSVPAVYDSNQFSGLVPLGGYVTSGYLFAMVHVEKYVSDLLTEYIEVIAIAVEDDGSGVSGSVLFSEAVYDPAIASPGENAYDNISQSISGNKAFIFCAAKYYLLEFSVVDGAPQVSSTEFDQPLSAYSGSLSDVQTASYPPADYSRAKTHSNNTAFAGYVGAVWSLDDDGVEQYDLIYASGYTQFSFSLSIDHDTDIHGADLWTGSASKTARHLITATVDGVTHTVVDRTYSASVSFTDEPSTYNLQAAFDAAASNLQTARKFLGGDRPTYVVALDSNQVTDAVSVFSSGAEAASVDGVLFNGGVGLGETLPSTFQFLLPSASTTPEQLAAMNYSNSSSDSGSVASPPVGLFLGNEGLVSSVRSSTLVSVETASGDVLNYANGINPFAEMLPDGGNANLNHAPIVPY